jgi:hypothetical protein
MLSMLPRERYGSVGPSLDTTGTRSGPAADPSMVSSFTQCARRWSGDRATAGATAARSMEDVGHRG